MFYILCILEQKYKLLKKDTVKQIVTPTNLVSGNELPLVMDCLKSLLLVSLLLKWQNLDVLVVYEK